MYSGDWLLFLFMNIGHGLEINNSDSGDSNDNIDGSLRYEDAADPEDEDGFNTNFDFDSDDSDELSEGVHDIFDKDADDEHLPYR